MSAKTGQKKATSKLKITNMFGTTEDMVVNRLDKEGVEIVVAKDDTGHYLTEAVFIDAPVADPNRFSQRKEVPKEYLESSSDSES